MLKIISKEKISRDEKDAYNHTTTFISFNTFKREAYLI